MSPPADAGRTIDDADFDDSGRASTIVATCHETPSATANQYGDMIEFGITDPAEVTRSAVENASSIAGMILTTEALITDKPEPQSAPAMPGGMGGMDY